MPYAACDHCHRIYVVDREVPGDGGSPAVACPQCAAELRTAPPPEALFCLSHPPEQTAPASTTPECGRKGGSVAAQDCVPCPAGRHLMEPAAPICLLCLQSNWNRARQLRRRVDQVARQNETVRAAFAQLTQRALSGDSHAIQRG